MDIIRTVQLLYTLQIRLTAICLWFEGRWWERVMIYTGIIELLGLTMQAHNEMVQLRNTRGLEWEYTPFYSREKKHQLFEDPLRTCKVCKTKRIRPSLKHIFLKKIKWGQYKDALFYIEGGMR